MYKIKDIETRINNKTVDIGDIGCRFYTEDENTAYVRIGINDEKGRINFKESNLTPKLHLFTEDGSIFQNEPVLIDDNVKGFLTYKIPKNVIKHVGMVRCKLFLENDHERIHVANFHFYIIDSGIDEAVQKEVNVDLVYTAINNTLKNNLFDFEGLKKAISDVILDKKDEFKVDYSSISSSPLSGLTGVFIGDSITEKNFRTTSNYHDYLAQRTGLKIVNMGISGTGYQDRKTVALKIKEQPDFISIFLGTNDWGLVGTKFNKLGSVKELSYDTVAGSIYFTLHLLTKHFPNTPIVIMTPLPRLECYPLKETPNKAGYTLGELVQVIKDVSKMFSLPVLDLYHNSNLKVWEPFVNEKYFAYEEGKQDGLHPNAKGHEFISHTIQKFLEDHAISPKIPYQPALPESEILESGATVKYVYPDAIYWKKEQSMIFNFSKGNIDLTGKKILKIESGTGSIVNSDGISSNSPYWYTLPTYEDGTKYNRTSEVQAFEDSLTKIGYTSGRGFEYMPELLKITYIDVTSNLTGKLSDSDGIGVNSPENVITDVDSPLYRTPQSDKPDEDLGDGIKATYVYPKRIFWIKNQSFTLNIDPFDFNIEEVKVLRVECNGKVLDKPDSVTSNSTSWYQIDNYADGTQYNKLSNIKKFVEGIPTISETAQRIDYKQSEIKIVYTDKSNASVDNIASGSSSSGSTSTQTSTTVEPRLNSDGSYTVEIAPQKVSWKQDQSFMINLDTKINFSFDKKNIKNIEYNNKQLIAPTSTKPFYAYWLTVLTETGKNNRTEEVTNFVENMPVKATESDGRIVYNPGMIKINYTQVG